MANWPRTNRVIEGSWTKPETNLSWVLRSRNICTVQWSITLGIRSPFITQTLIYFNSIPNRPDANGLFDCNCCWCCCCYWIVPSAENNRFNPEMSNWSESSPICAPPPHPTLKPYNHQLITNARAGCQQPMLNRYKRFGLCNVIQPEQDRLGSVRWPPEMNLQENPSSSPIPSGFQ